jgi:hypothetical protein
LILANGWSAKMSVFRRVVVLRPGGYDSLRRMGVNNRVVVSASIPAT